MVRKTNDIEKFWQELKRRKVVHVITVYVALAFGILQLVDIISPSLHWPDWTITFVVVLLCIGFVIAVFLSWIYDITPAGVKKTKPVSAIKHKDQSTHTGSSGWKIATYIGAVIIVALIVFNFINKRNLNADISKLDKSIAILPFVNDSPDTANMYFCNGMMDEILTQLQKIGNLKVKARTSVEKYRNPDKDIKDIGKELGVSFIMEGSVRKIDDNLRITAQLINAKSGDHLWADTYNGKYTTKIFEFQSNVAKKVAASLDAVITPKEKQLIEKVSTANLEAYTLYLKGTYFWELMTVEGLQEASKYYEQALQKDPDYALAYIGLANVNGGSAFWGHVPPHEAIPKSIEYTDKAMKIDSTLAEAYWILANANTYYYWNWKEAERNYKRALEINPNSYQIHLNYSDLLTITGRYDEAISEAERALELDSLSAYVKRYTATIFGETGQYDRAIEELKMALTIDPKDYNTYYNLGIVYLLKGMNKEAATELEKAVDLSEENSSVIAWLVFSYYAIGENDKADKLFDSLKKRSETEYVPATCFFTIYRIREEEDLAFEWLKRACTEHDTYLCQMRLSSYFFPEGSKYMALLKEVGL
jgi:TolB-like protein/Tfp pilus assembly protein PilF